MAYNTLAGMPLTIHGSVVDTVFSELEGKALKEKTVIEKAGATVTGVHLRSDGAPLRYWIKFAGGTQMQVVRRKLEEQQFDVGQQMGESMLNFYATKRVEQGKGWQV